MSEVRFLREDRQNLETILHLKLLVRGTRVAESCKGQILGFSWVVV